MYSFDGSTADQVWGRAAEVFRTRNGTASTTSRAGETGELLHASFTIREPRQRWVFSRVPAINPAFAIAEVFWILAGRNDAAFLTTWNRQLPQYAGTGPTFHGSYGHRLRASAGFDQLAAAHQVLRERPDTRQVVLQIWEPTADFPHGDGSPRSADIPCNVCAVLKVRQNRLHWLQILRSNDLILGVPYNFVQFTSLQEIMAGWLGIEVGEYCHVADSLHIYHGDRDTLDSRQTFETGMNTDSLLLPKDQFDPLLNRVVETIERLGNSDTSRRAERDLLENEWCPPAYRHLLLVVGAEAARRRRDSGAADRLISLCDNPALKAVWINWRRRLNSALEHS